jgi:hypothetical protein
MARRRSRNTTTTPPTEAPPSRAPADPPAARPAWLVPALAVCLLVGLPLCHFVGYHRGWTGVQLIGLGVAGLLAAIPASRRVIVSALDRLRRLDAPALNGATALCFAVALLYLLGTAYVQAAT